MTPSGGAATGRAPGRAAAVRAQGVSKSFGATTVLDRCSIEVAPGEIVALLGPSGCGKTTLLRCIAGLERPDRGSIAVGGTLVADADGIDVPPERRGVGLVFQDGALFPHLDVAANVAYGLPRGMSTPERSARVAQMLEMVRLEGFGPRRPDELSGGQRQRVALARALAPRPAVLLLDEPFSSLDARLRRELRTEVAEVLREAGTPAIVVTHDRDEAFAMADRVAVMRGGRIAQTGSPVEVYDHPVDEWVARFVGDANILTVTEGGTRQVGCALGKIRVIEPVETGSLVMLRPEQIAFERSTTWPLGVVVGIEFTGSRGVVEVDADGLRLRSEQSWRSASRLNVGDQVVARLLEGTAAVPIRPRS